MLRRVVPVLAAAAVFGYGAAFAFTFAPMTAVQTMLIHASGSVTGEHTSGSVSPPPPTPPTPTPTPPPSAPPAQVAPPSFTVPSLGFPGVAPATNNAPISVPSTSATGGGIAPSRGDSRGRVSIAEPPARKVTVALLKGGQITAARMRLGLHDALTVKNGKTVVAVAIAQIAGVEFGEKELGRLAVTVNMVDGSVLIGNVYPGTVFEFEGKGRVTATRAEEIASIAFPAE